MDRSITTRHRFPPPAELCNAARANVSVLSPQHANDVASSYKLSHLGALEAQSIYIMREVAAEFERPALLFSGGKDSVCLLALAEKAFRPGPFPFPLLHIDTGHNFPEVIAFRDRRAQELGERLDRRARGGFHPPGQRGAAHADASPRNPFQTSPCWKPSGNSASTPASAAPAGTRRRPGPRSGSSASGTSSGSGIPSTSGRSCGTSTTPAIHPGEHIRVFPISNWTELDVWQYIAEQGIEVPSHLLRPRAAAWFVRDGPCCRSRPTRARRAGAWSSTCGCGSAPWATSRLHRPVSSRRPGPSRTSSRRWRPRSSPNGAPPA